jgi:hypothetical protein
MTMTKLDNLSQISFPNFAANLMHHSIEAGNQVSCTSLGNVAVYLSSWVMPTAYAAAGATTSVAGTILFAAGTVGAAVFWVVGCGLGCIDWASKFIYQIHLSRPFPEFSGVKATAGRCGDHVVGIFIFTIGTIFSGWAVGCAERWKLAPSVIEARIPKPDPIADLQRQFKKLTEGLEEQRTVIEELQEALEEQEGKINTQKWLVTQCETRLDRHKVKINEIVKSRNKLVAGQSQMQEQLSELPASRKDLNEAIHTCVLDMMSDELFQSLLLGAMVPGIKDLVARAVKSEKQLPQDDLWSFLSERPASPPPRKNVSLARPKQAFSTTNLLTVGRFNLDLDPKRLVGLRLPIGLRQILETVAENPIIIPAMVMSELQKAPQETIKCIYAFFLLQARTKLSAILA